jgi:DNA-binding transcriptional MerR regulator
MVNDLVESPSQAALARALSISAPAVTKLKKLGMPVHSIDAAVEWRRARLNIAKRKPTPPQHDPAPARAQGAQSLEETHDEARTRREIAEADLAELKLAELQRVLVRADAVKSERDREHAMVREAFLQLPARLVPLLVAADGAADMARILQQGITDALRMLSEAD